MNIDFEVIRNKFREFWRCNKKVVKFYYKGKEINPTEVSSFSIQEIGPFDEENRTIKCSTLNLRLLIDDLEKNYTGEITLMIDFRLNNNHIPCEEVIGIKDNSIYLK